MNDTFCIEIVKIEPLKDDNWIKGFQPDVMNNIIDLFDTDEGSYLLEGMPFQEAINIQMFILRLKVDRMKRLVHSDEEIIRIWNLSFKTEYNDIIEEIEEAGAEVKYIDE